jgi:dCMP deaminase
VSDVIYHARPSLDEYFIGMLPGVAARSTDPRCKVACIIVGPQPDNDIRTTGYNGLPRGANDDIAERFFRPEKNWWMEHAEANAILNHARSGGSGLKGCTAYVCFHPCMRCARALVQAGIRRVVIDLAEHKLRWTVDWEDDFQRATQLFRETRVEVAWWTKLPPTLTSYAPTLTSYVLGNDRTVSLPHETT